MENDLLRKLMEVFPLNTEEQRENSDRLVQAYTDELNRDRYRDPQFAGILKTLMSRNRVGKEYPRIYVGVPKTDKWITRPYELGTRMDVCIGEDTMYTTKVQRRHSTFWWLPAPTGLPDEIKAALVAGTEVVVYLSEED